VKTVKHLFSFVILFLLSKLIIAQVPVSGLVAYYPFNGNANDESGYGNDGVVDGATLTSDRCGNPNSAYYFDGINDGITVPNNPQVDFDNDEDFTIALWIKTTFSSDEEMVIDKQFAGYWNGYLFAVNNVDGGYCTANGHIMFYGASGGQQDACSNGRVNSGDWVFITGVFRSSANELILYINGVQQNDVGSVSGNIKTTQDLLIGYGPTCDISSGYYYYQGSIDDICMYNRVLSQAEIQYLYQMDCNQLLPVKNRIIGSDSVCQGQNSVSYQVIPSKNIVNYVWSYSGSGVSIQGSSDSIQLNFAKDATSGILKLIYRTDSIEDTINYRIIVNDCFQYCGIKMADGLVAYYPFNCNANDESGYGNNGVVDGATLTTDRCGNPNSAYYFDGINDRITVPNNPQVEFGDNVDFTFTLWLETIFSGNEEMVIDKQFTGYGNGYLLAVNNVDPGYCTNPGHAMLYIGGNDACSDAKVNNGSWTFLTGVYNHADQMINIYVNGVLQSDYAVGAGNIATVQDLLIGYAPNGYYFQGSIDDICMYDRALSQEEIQCLFQLNCSVPVSPASKIKGQAIVCAGDENVGYSAKNMVGVLTYSWSYSGSGVTISGNSDTVNLNFGEDATSGILKVYGFKSGVIDSASIAITVNSCNQDCGFDLADGLVAYYPFNGNANDESGNLNNGIIYGPVFTGDRFGNQGSALLFDGTDDYVRIPDNETFNVSNSITIAAWIKSFNTTGPRDIVSKWNDNTWDHSFIFKDHNSSDKLRIELSKQSHNDLVDLKGQTSITLDDWIFVAVTFDANSVKLYYNGNLDGSASVSGSIERSSTDLLIGAVYTGGGISENFSGAIDDVQIYNNALSQEEIECLYQSKHSLPISQTNKIKGEESVCAGMKNVNYNVQLPDNFSGYYWNYSGSGVSLSINSNTINLDFTDDATSGYLRVVGIENGTGSLDSAKLYITVNPCDSIVRYEFNIPNTFTPNGDGINEVFYIQDLPPNSKLVVFNRLGKTVYATDDYQNDWEGKDSNGNLLATDTYWYIFTLPGKSKEFKGYIYIRR
jgi:gliding motility-associated-like protein